MDNNTKSTTHNNNTLRDTSMMMQENLAPMLSLVSPINENSLCVLNTFTSNKHQMLLEEDNAFLRRQLRQVEAESKKQIALLKQTLELKEQEFNELKIAQDQLKKMNESIMSAFNDMSSKANMNSTANKAIKELEVATNQYNKEINELRARNNDIVSNYEIENRKLKERIEEAEIRYKELELTMKNERLMHNNQKLNELEIQNLSYVKLYEDEKKINKELEQANQDLLTRYNVLKSDSDKIKNEYKNMIETMSADHDRKIKELYDSEKLILEARINKTQNLVRKYTEDGEKDIPWMQIQQNYKAEIENLKKAIIDMENTYQHELEQLRIERQNAENRADSLEAELNKLKISLKGNNQGILESNSKILRDTMNIARSITEQSQGQEVMEDNRNCKGQLHDVKSQVYKTHDSEQKQDEMKLNKDNLMRLDNTPNRARFTHPNEDKSLSSILQRGGDKLSCQKSKKPEQSSIKKSYVNNENDNISREYEFEKSMNAHTNSNTKNNAMENLHNKQNLMHTPTKVDSHLSNHQQQKHQIQQQYQNKDTMSASKTSNSSHTKYQKSNYEQDDAVCSNRQISESKNSVQNYNSTCKYNNNGGGGGSSAKNKLSIQQQHHYQSSVNISSVQLQQYKSKDYNPSVPSDNDIRQVTMECEGNDIIKSRLDSQKSTVITKPFNDIMMPKSNNHHHISCSNTSNSNNSSSTLDKILKSKEKYVKSQLLKDSSTKKLETSNNQFIKDEEAKRKMRIDLDTLPINLTEILIKQDKLQCLDMTNLLASNDSRYTDMLDIELKFSEPIQSSTSSINKPSLVGDSIGIIDDNDSDKYSINNTNINQDIHTKPTERGTFNPTDHNQLIGMNQFRSDKGNQNKKLQDNNNQKCTFFNNNNDNNNHNTGFCSEYSLRREKLSLSKSNNGNAYRTEPQCNMMTMTTHENNRLQDITPKKNFQSKTQEGFYQPIKNNRLTEDDEELKTNNSGYNLKKSITQTRDRFKEIENKIKELELKNEGTKIERDKVQLEVEKLKLEIEVARFENQKQENKQKPLIPKSNTNLNLNNNNNKQNDHNIEFANNKIPRLSHNSSFTNNSTKSSQLINDANIPLPIQQQYNDNKDSALPQDKETAYKTEIKFLINNLLKARNKLEQQSSELNLTRNNTNNNNTLLNTTSSQLLNPNIPNNMTAHNTTTKNSIILKKSQYEINEEHANLNAMSSELIIAPTETITPVPELMNEHNNHNMNYLPYDTNNNASSPYNTYKYTSEKDQDDYDLKPNLIQRAATQSGIGPGEISPMQHIKNKSSIKSNSNNEKNLIGMKNLYNSKYETPQRTHYQSHHHQQQHIITHSPIPTNSHGKTMMRNSTGGYNYDKSGGIQSLSSSSIGMTYQSNSASKKKL